MCVSFCNQPKAHFGLPWDNHGKCHRDENRIQCLPNASQHIPIYLQPFTSYSEILVGNCNFFLPPLHLTPLLGVFPLEFHEKFGPQKTRIMGLPCSEDSLTIDRAISTQYQRVMDGQTDVQPISITCAVWLTHVKNVKVACNCFSGFIAHFGRVCYEIMLILCAVNNAATSTVWSKNEIQFDGVSVMSTLSHICQILLSDLLPAAWWVHDTGSLYLSLTPKFKT